MNRTRWIIAGLTAGILLIDVYLAATGGVDATISIEITRWAHEYPVVAFACGFLAGHLFAQNQKGRAP